MQFYFFIFDFFSCRIGRFVCYVNRAKCFDSFADFADTLKCIRTSADIGPVVV
jgi:hypothetical protein